MSYPCATEKPCKYHGEDGANMQSAESTYEDPAILSANVQLIAAAPDLLALAEQVVERLPFDTDHEAAAWLHNHLAPLARSAIAKATGANA